QRAVGLPPAEAAAEEIREDVTEAGFIPASGTGTPAERARAGVRPRPARLAVGVDLAMVVLPALHRVADDVVGGRDLLEPLLRRAAVAGIDVGMQLLGQLAIGPANLLVGRIARHSQHLVGVLGHIPSPSSLHSAILM